MNIKFSSTVFDTFKPKIIIIILDEFNNNGQENKADSGGTLPLFTQRLSASSDIITGEESLRSLKQCFIKTEFKQSKFKNNLSKSKQSTQIKTKASKTKKINRRKCYTLKKAFNNESKKVILFVLKILQHHNCRKDFQTILRQYKKTTCEKLNLLTKKCIFYIKQYIQSSRCSAAQSIKKEISNFWQSKSWKQKQQKGSRPNSSYFLSQTQIVVEIINSESIKQNQSLIKKYLNQNGYNKTIKEEIKNFSDYLKTKKQQEQQNPFIDEISTNNNMFYSELGQSYLSLEKNQNPTYQDQGPQVLTAHMFEEFDFVEQKQFCFKFLGQSEQSFNFEFFGGT